jgi:hypothetical protein
MAAIQDGYGFGVPMLFNLEQPAANTPHTPHSPLRESGTISSARRSVTPPGSVHTDTTPPRAPPTARLHDIVMTGGSCAVVCCELPCPAMLVTTITCGSCTASYPSCLDSRLRWSPTRGQLTMCWCHISAHMFQQAGLLPVHLL